MSVSTLMRRLAEMKSDNGFVLMEVLVAAIVLAVMGVGLVSASMFSIKMRDKAIRDSISVQLVQEELEQFAASDPLTLSDGDSYSETITRNGMTFQRQSVVVVNADNSRTVTVTAAWDSHGMVGNVNLSTTFIPWEST